MIPSEAIVRIKSMYNKEVNVNDKEPYKYILCDIEMPEMNGYSVVE